MNHTPWMSQAQRLRERGEAFALVTVLKALAPTSAKPGDKAIVTADGQIHGWIGGGCAQPAVIKTVRRALRDGQARHIRVTPKEEGGDVVLGDVLEFGMGCPSGGTLELFVDPILPDTRLLVVGDSPVARALAGLAPRVGFAVTALAHGAHSADFPDAQQVLNDDTPDAVRAAWEMALPKFQESAPTVVASTLTEMAIGSGSRHIAGRTSTSADLPAGMLQPSNGQT